MLTRTKVLSLTIVAFLVLSLVHGTSSTAAPLSVNPAHRLTNPLSAGTTTRVSVASDGTQGNDGSWNRSISADGRYVAFYSPASNLVGGDTNGDDDIFVHDRQTGETTRVSVASNGGQGNDDSEGPSISADGRYVTFISMARDLISDDTNGYLDVFVHDRQTGQTTRVSVASDGTQGNDFSYYPSISADGRYVAFDSRASNLVSGDTNGNDDIFVHDRQTGQTTRVSVASDGEQGNGYCSGASISADGRYVAFHSGASNLVSGDTNGDSDIFVHDRQTGQTTRVSVASDGGQGNSSSGWPSISADGRYVVFGSYASNLVSGDTNGTKDIFVHDRQTGQTTRVSVASDGGQGNSSSGWPSISADGRYVAFGSYASNLVSGDTNGTGDIFIRDRQTGQTTRVSVASDGGQGNDSSWWPSISTDGRYVAFDSGASNLVSGDTNSARDVFVHDREGGGPVDLSISAVTPIQVLEGQPLVVNKATAVRVVVNKSGSGSVNNVQVKLTFGTEELTSFYVSEENNWDGEFRLQQDNTAYPLNFSVSEMTKTIYFFDNVLVPAAAGSYDVAAKVDPLNLIPETDEMNNIGSASGVTAYEAKWGPWPFSSLRLRYIPVEQPRSQAVIHYAETGTDFIEWTYPVAASNLKDGVSILPCFRCPLCLLPNEFGLRMALIQVFFRGKAADWFADRIIGIAPAGWLHDNYPHLPKAATGYTVWPTAAAFVEMAGISTTAHEAGHSYGLWIGCEEYDADCDDTPDNLGNTVHGGLRVSDRTVMNDGDTKDTTRHGVYCFMGTANYDPPTIDRFVDAQDYQALAAQSGVTGQAMSNLKAEEGIVLVMGIIGKDNSAEFLDWYRLPEGAADATEPGPYVLTALDGAGEVLYEQPFTMTFTTVGAITPTLEEAPFAFAMPFISGTTDFELQHEGQTLITRTVSAHAPTVTVLSPNGGEVLTGSGTVEWTADDADADTLSYAVLLSTDNGTTWSTAALGMTTTLHSLNVSALPPGTGNLVKVIATDGVNTGQDESDAPFTIISNVYIPIILKDY